MSRVWVLWLFADTIFEEQRFPELWTATVRRGRTSWPSADESKEDMLSMEFVWNTGGKDGKDIRRNGWMRGAGCKETGEKDSEVGKLIRVCVVMPRYTVQLSLKLGADLRSMFTGGARSTHLGARTVRVLVRNAGLWAQERHWKKSQIVHFWSLEVMYLSLVSHLIITYFGY